MSTEKAFTRRCIRCAQTLPIKAFAIRNNIMSPMCLNCEALSDADTHRGGGGPKLHKDYYSKRRLHGEKSVRNITTEKHQEDKKDKRILDEEKKQDKKDELKQKKVKSFLRRLRDTKSLFTINTEKTGATPAVSEETRDFLAASEYLKGQHDTNASVIDPSGVRAGISREHWKAHSGAVRSWATSAAVHSHTQKSSTMINPYNTWQRRAMLGDSESRTQQQAKKDSQRNQSEEQDNPAEKDIKSWHPRSNKK